MSIIQCPTCHSHLRRPAGEVQQIRCPKCQTLLKIASQKAATQSQPNVVTSKSVAASNWSNSDPGGSIGNPSSSFKIACAQCSKAIRVPESARGRRVQCPGCKVVMQIPKTVGAVTPTPQVSNTAPSQLQELPVNQPSPAQSDPFAALDESSSAPTDPFVTESDPFALPQPDTLPNQYGATNPLGFAAMPQAAAPGTFPVDPSPQGQAMGGGMTPYQAPKESNPYESTQVDDSDSSLYMGEVPGVGAACLTIFGSLVAIFLLVLVVTLMHPVLGGILAFIFYIAAILGGLAGGIWLIVIAFEDDSVQGLLCALVPFYAVYYMFTNWSKVWLPSMISWVSSLALIGAFLGLIVGVIFSAASDMP